MELWTGFLLGLVGSLHCAGMCGPLAFALPATGRTWLSLLAGRAAYNLGRIVTYCVLGGVFGLAGQSFALAGFQRWLSLIAGVAVLAGLASSCSQRLGVPAAKAANRVKTALARLLCRGTLATSFSFGLINGFLPCGLVYAACAAAAASASLLTGAQSMLAFGLGTVPMMLAISLAGQKLQLALRFKLQRLIPASLVLVGVLLILRGLSLGIPYLSPDLSTAHGNLCH
ncbi:MAG: sulfite exporter TauE/SafE family protein [Verrucomicrobia bacterium]|nr:sulfite exporter TauE/SafE family protein [Verrucomicrobiota bacterium]